MCCGNRGCAGTGERDALQDSIAPAGFVGAVPVSGIALGQPATLGPGWWQLDIYAVSDIAPVQIRVDVGTQGTYRVLVSEKDKHPVTFVRRVSSSQEVQMIFEQNFGAGNLQAQIVCTKIRNL